MPLTTIIKNGKPYQVDTEAMGAEGRARFDNDVKSGAVMVLAEPKAPKVKMETVTAPLRFKGKDSAGREGASFWTPEATNRARTVMAGMPGAAMGGPVGMAANLAYGALAPDSMMDKTVGESAGNAASGLLSFGLANKLKAINNPVGREMISGALGGAGGSAVQQGVDTGTVAPGMMGLAGGGQGVASGALGGGLEYLRKSTKTGMMSDLMKRMTGKDIHPSEFTPAPTTGVGGTALANSPANPASPFNVRAEEILRSKAAQAEKKLAMVATENVTPSALPKPSLQLPKEVQDLQQKVLLAGSPGERNYHTAKLQELGMDRRNAQLTENYEKLIGAPATFETKNKEIFKSSIDSTKKELTDIDREADLIKEAYASRKKVGDVQGMEKLDAEFNGLAETRGRLISDRNQTIASLVELDRNRMVQMQTYGYDKEAAEEGLKTLQTQVASSNLALPPAVRAAMVSVSDSSTTPTRGLTNYLGNKDTSGGDFKQVYSYMQQEGKGAVEDMKSSVVNDFFTRARNEARGDYSNLGAALEAYNADKLGTLYGSPKEGEKFRDLAQTIIKANQGPSTPRFATVAGIKSAVSLLGSSLIFSDTSHLSATGLAGGAGAVISIALPYVMEKAMKSPAFYHAFKDYAEASAKGLKIPAGKEVIDFVKKYGNYRTPQEIDQARMKAQQDMYEAGLEKARQAQQEGGTPPPQQPGPTGAPTSPQPPANGPTPPSNAPPMPPPPGQTPPMPAQPGPGNPQAPPGR